MVPSTSIMGIERNRVERIWILAKSDFLQRYFGSSLGLLWALINPMAKLLVYYFVFSYLVFRQESENFAMYLFCGLILWTFFSESTKKGIRVLVTKRYLMENIRISKIDIYYSHIISTFLGLLFNLGSYFIIAYFFGISYSLNLLYLPLFLIIMAVFSFAVSIILSLIFIYLKDLDHIWDIVLLVGFWSIPIIWDQNLVLDEFVFMHYINPITGLLVNMRNVMLYDTSPDFQILAYDTLYVLVMLGISMFMLRLFGHKAAEIT